MEREAIVELLSGGCAEKIGEWVKFTGKLVLLLFYGTLMDTD